jgi:hypothetical protein
MGIHQKNPEQKYMNLNYKILKIKNDIINSALPDHLNIKTKSIMDSIVIIL